MEATDRPGVALTDLWETGSPPAMEVTGDPAGRPVVLHPPAGGTVFRVIQFDPEEAGAWRRPTQQPPSRRWGRPAKRTWTSGRATSS